MAGPAVNLASVLVVRKSLGSRFTWIYLLTIIGFSILFGLLINATGLVVSPVASGDACCTAEPVWPTPFKLVCASILTLLILFAFAMKLFDRFVQKEADPDSVVYTVEGMACSHCEAAVCRAVEEIPGVESAKASASGKKLTIKGTAAEEDIRAAVEKAGYTFKGRKE